MGPTAYVSCQLNLKLFVSKQYDFLPIVSCQLSQNLKFRVCQFVSKTNLSVVSEKYG